MRERDPSPGEGGVDGGTPPSAALLAAVLGEFGLGEASSARAVRGGSRRNAKFVVDSPEGRWFLKEQRASAARGSLLAASVQRLLADHGAPVPAPRAAVDGRPFVERDGRCFELLPFVEGGRFDGSAQAARAAGATLARLHQLLAAWRPPEGVRGSYHDSARVRTVLAALAASPDRPGVVRWRERLAALAAEYDDASVRAGSLVDRQATQLVHGDYHPGNLLFAGTQVVAVLDWEAVREDVPLAEFASAALQFSREDPRLGPEAPLRIGRLAAFAEGHGGLGRGAAEAVPALLVEAAVAESAFVLEGSLDPARAEAQLATTERLAAAIRGAGSSIAGCLRR